MKPTILVADAERNACDILEDGLRGAGFAPIVATDGVDAMKLAREHEPGVIVLEVMLPGLDGFEVCRRLRSDEATASIPVIFLTSRAGEMDRIVGFELGADDYVTKPFSAREFILRVKRSLRQRKPEKHSTVFMSGGLAVDFRRHEVTLEGHAVQLTATEFRLLEVLVRDAGYLYKREQLLKTVWDYETNLKSRTVDTHIRRLREKLGSAAGHIESIRGEGYRFVTQF